MFPQGIELWPFSPEGDSLSCVRECLHVCVRPLFSGLLAATEHQQVRTRARHLLVRPNGNCCHRCSDSIND